MNNKIKDNKIIGVTYSTSTYVEFNKNKDKDIFEEVIIDMSMFDDDTKDFIKNLPDNEKRLAVLSLNMDDNVLWPKIYDIQSSSDTKYNKVKSIIILLRDYVKTVDVAKKEHGEVLTPFNELAKPMVNLVDKYDSNFWKDKNNKVLDSSAGYGTFLILCLYKFMEGLKNVIIDEDERLKHIIENQLYYGELQSKSVFSWLVSIDIENKYKTNIYWGSYLDDGFDYHMKTVWGVEKFDLIIQNPPYQKQKPGFTKTQPIWHLFVQRSLELLKEDGYMIMVHPSGWRNVDGVFKETQNLLKSKQVLELHIQNEKDGMRVFGAETRYDFYILKNTTPEKETLIKCQDGSFEVVNISEMQFIPNGMFNDIVNLVAKDVDEKVEVIADSSYHTQRDFMSKSESTLNKYPCIYTVKSGDIPTIWYSNINSNGHFGIPKLIWSNFRISSAGCIVDEDGIYGLTQFSYAIVDSVGNLNNIKKAFDSKEFRDLMEMCAVGDMTINRKSIATFRKDFWKEFI